MLDQISTFSNLDTSCQMVIRLFVMSYWLEKKNINTALTALLCLP